jgi:hypothetical protein
MSFAETKWFPFTVGFSLLAVAIAFGAVGWVSPKFSACIAVFGVGFVLDGSAGVHALPFLGIWRTQRQVKLAEQLLYSKERATPRYVFAISLGVMYLAVNLLSNSELVEMLALIACATSYGIVSSVSLFRAFGEAGERLRADVS